MTSPSVGASARRSPDCESAAVRLPESFRVVAPSAPNFFGLSRGREMQYRYARVVDSVQRKCVWGFGFARTGVTNGMTHPELYILRHGETVWNNENRMQGWLNSPLTPKGELDAARQGEILRKADLDAFMFWCSPSGRAIQTAGIACSMAQAIHTDIRLREIGVGDWAGALRDELPAGTGSDPYMAQYEMAPNGEGLAALTARCQAFVNDLNGPAVLITHGITSRVIRSIVAGPDALAKPSIHGGQGCVYHLKDGVQKLLT